ANALAEQLTACAGDLERLCITALREARNREAMAAGIKAVQDDLRVRKERLETGAETIRAAVAQAMQEAGMPKLTAPDMTVSFRAGKAPLVIEGDADQSTAEAHKDFVRVKIAYAWDREAIRHALEHGETLPFARLGNPMPTLTLRSK